jgi:DNA-binding winged helix-turn-helix (wHTH) protein/Tfp pilus assembly protein PilF
VFEYPEVEPNGRHRFGDFQIDLDAELVSRDGIRIPLAPQPYRLLHYLLHSRGRVVNREELKHLLWDEGTFVDFDRSLNFCVLQLRQALADDARSPEYIETVPRKGYRFIAEVTPLPETEPLPARPAGRRIAIAAGVVALIVMFAAALVQNAERARSANSADASRHEPLVSRPKTRHDPRAFEEYLRGRAAIARRTAADIEAGALHLQRAVAIEPAFASAHASLAETWRLLQNFRRIPAPVAGERIGAEANAALRLDPDLAAAHSVAGMWRFYYVWDFAGAERELALALRMNPSDGGARHDYGWLLIARGRSNAGVEQIRRAQELDPLSLRANIDVAWACTYAGRYDEAIAEALRTLGLNREYEEAHRCLQQTYELQGNYAAAVNEVQRRLQTAGKAAEWNALATLPPREALRRVHEQQLASMLSAGPAADPYVIAQQLAWLGRDREAWPWLDRALEHRSSSLPMVAADPMLASLRNTPRFQELVRRVGVR